MVTSNRVLLSNLVILISAIMVLGLPQVAAADMDRTDVSNAAVLFLVVSNSPRVNGMGGCGIALIDEQSSLYNPAAVGVFHLDKVFSISSPSSTDWLPTLDLDMRYKTFNVSVGGSTRLLKPDQKTHLSFGLAYSRIKLDYGRLVFTDAEGNEIGYGYPEEEAHCFTLGFGIEHIARLGLGLTMKKIDSRLSTVGAGEEKGDGTAKATAFDIGLYAELPLGRLMTGKAESDMNIELTPALAYVLSNIGNDITYVDAAQADPFPTIHRISLSIYGGLKSRGATLASLRISWEHERSALSIDPDPINKFGGELGIGNVLFIRGGFHHDDAGELKYPTFGAGLSLQGILQFIETTQPEEGDTFLRYLLTHADFSVDYAKYFGDTPLEGTNFLKMSLSF